MNDVDDNGPIFIGGPDRSGKTLLAAILGSHSQVAIPIVGSNLWSYFYGQYGDLRRDDNFEHCLMALLRYKHARFLDPDPARLRAEFRGGERTYARLFALIHEHFAERRGKPRWGDQTGLIEQYADQILGAYRGARIIHMIRDPRDRYEASLRMWPKGRARAGGAVARWRYSVALGERNLARWADRYRIVRYEDLVTDPERVTITLSRFLGMDFEPEMLAMQDASSFRQKLIAGGGTPERLVTNANIGAYRGVIPPSDLAFIQGRLRDAMDRHGYAPDSIEMDGATRLRYLGVEWPLNTTRMAAWGVLEVLQNRFPSVIGRRPSADMVVKAQDASANPS
ncbi:MAG: sulfotransferase [Chloroflexota bacterium]|nr:sulfotransferase [Chloroflexota bacterium]